MPTYVYRFIDSGKIVEVQQAFSDEPFTTMVDPTDGAVRAVKKVFTPVGVSFKGDGFYKTDSRTKSSASATSATSATGSGQVESTSNSDSAAGAKSENSSDTTSSSAGAPASSTPASTTTQAPASTPVTTVAP